LTRQELTAISGLSARTSSWGGEGSLFFPLDGLLVAGGEDISMGVCAGVDFLESRKGAISSSEDGGDERADERGEDSTLMLGESYSSVRLLFGWARLAGGFGGCQDGTGHVGEGWRLRAKKPENQTEPKIGMPITCATATLTA
jgi:hypothetical protein